MIFFYEAYTLIFEKGQRMEIFAIILMLAGAIGTLIGYGKVFKTSDKRTKTGYKDNEEPDYTGCLQLIAGPIVVLVGFTLLE